MTAVRILSAADLMALVLPEPRWAVHEVVPEGLTILAGRPKLGKSWLVLAIALAIALGGRAFGQLAVEAGDVLCLMLEDSAKRLQSRLGMLLAGVAPPDRLYLAREWPRADQGGVEAIAEWLATHRSARLVVVDTHARFRAQRRGRERGYADDVADLEPLQQLAIRHQVAIVVLHHLRKGGADDWIDTISGTLGLAGVADGLLGLFRARGESQATLKVTGRDVEEREFGLRFDPPTGTWWMLGEAADTVQLGDGTRRMLDAMSRVSRPATARELAGYTGQTYDAARKLLQRLREDGHVVGSRDGWAIARAHARTQHVPGVPPPLWVPGTPGTSETHRTIETEGTLSLGDDDGNLLSLDEYRPRDVEEDE